MNSIKLMELPIEECVVLTQTLQAALASSRALPVMFNLREDIGEPSPGQIIYQEEILSDALNNWVIRDEFTKDIAECLYFMLDEFDMFLADKHITVDRGNKIVPGYEYILRTFGIEYTKDFRSILAKYAELVWLLGYGVPRKKIVLTNATNYEDALAEMLKAVNAGINELLDKVDAGNDPDYSAYNLGIIFNGTRYVLDCCAAEHNALVAMLESIIEQQ